MNKTPKLRFKEFSGDWESKNLGELGQSIIGLTYSPDDVVDNGVLVLRSSNIKNNKIVYTDNVFVNMQIQEKIMTRENDILICSRNGSRGLIGKSALIDNSSANNAFGAFMTIFRADQGKFIFQLLQGQKFFKQIHQNLGATINQITSKDLNSMQFYAPSIEEQEKIASLFSLIDDKISLQGEKVDALKDYKKGMMQKIFSRELRFKDDDGRDYPEWEEKKLNEVTTYVDYRGKTPTKSEKGIFLVTARNIKNGYIDYSASQEYISEDSYDNAMSRGLPKIGDVLLTTEAPLGNVAQIDREKIALAQRVIKFRGTNELNNTYLKYYFLSEYFQINLTNKAIGTTVLGIQGKVLHKMLIKVPVIEEQYKIGEFLLSLENKINKEQDKLDSLNEYKKGLLQQMFV